MLRKYFLPVFLLIVLLDLYAVYTGNAFIQFLVKPLVLASLICYFIVETVKEKAAASSGRLISFLLAGLIFSLAGDVLLMFDSDPMFFILGLSSFLLAHVFYILFFVTIMRAEKWRIKPLVFIPVAIYYILLVSILYPVLGGMKLPVLIYGLVLSSMFGLAMQMRGPDQNRNDKWLGLGAAFFVISDSVLAFNKFYQPFPMAGLITMSTYAVAQYFIVIGALQYMRTKKSSI